MIPIMCDGSFFLTYTLLLKMTIHIQYEIHDKSHINNYVNADGMWADGTEGFLPATRGSPSGLRFAPMEWLLKSTLGGYCVNNHINTNT